MSSYKSNIIVQIIAISCICIISYAIITLHYTRLFTKEINAYKLDNTRGLGGITKYFIISTILLLISCLITFFIMERIFGEDIFDELLITVIICVFVIHFGWILGTINPHIIYVILILLIIICIPVVLFYYL